MPSTGSPLLALRFRLLNDVMGLILPQQIFQLILPQIIEPFRPDAMRAFLPHKRLTTIVGEDRIAISLLAPAETVDGFSLALTPALQLLLTGGPSHIFITGGNSACDRLL